MLLSITYLSSATERPDAAALVDLLAHARARNAANDVTGMLLYAEGSFAQSLEGPEEAVRATFDRILVDPRHRGVYVALEEHVEDRSFPDWSMSFRDLNSAPPSDVEGFTTFLTDVRAGRAVPGDTDPHHVLRAFSRPRF